MLAFVLALLFILPTLHLLSLETRSFAHASLAQEKMLALERRYYEDLALKEAAAQALRSADGPGIREKVLRAAGNLALLETYAEGYYAERGIAADFWFGVLWQGEAQALAGTIGESRKAEKCGACFDFSAMVLDYDKKPVPKSVSVLYAGAGDGVRVSKNGLALAPLPEAVYGDIYLGGSFYDGGAKAAFVSLMPEGFG